MAGLSIDSWVSNACVSDSGVHISSLWCQCNISYISIVKFILFLDFAGYNIASTSLPMKYKLRKSKRINSRYIYNNYNLE